MKRKLWLILFSSLILIGSIASSTCFTQLSMSFNKSSYLAGESGIFSVTIGESSAPIYFTNLEIFFDWGSYWDSGVTIVSPGDTKVKSVQFYVPSSVSSGSHSFYYKLTWSLDISLQDKVSHTSPTNIFLIREIKRRKERYDKLGVAISVEFNYKCWH